MESLEEKLKEVRGKISMSLHSNSFLKNGRYKGLAEMELEIANNWLSQLFHVVGEGKVHVPGEQKLEMPEEWVDWDYIDDNRKRIQDTINLMSSLTLTSNHQAAIARNIMNPLMQAKMWLGNQLDLESKVKAASEGKSSLILPK